MALIKCSECDHIVSNKASSCPHCGKVMRTSNLPHDLWRQSATLSPSKPDYTGNAIAGSLVLITAVGILACVALLFAGWWAYNNLINPPIGEVMFNDVDTTVVAEAMEDYLVVNEPEVDTVVVVTSDEYGVSVEESHVEPAVVTE